MDLLMDILKDKSKLISFLISTIEDTQKEKEGLAKMSECLTRDNPNLSPENIAKCLATTMKITAKQSHTLQNLAVIALIACSSSDFDGDVAKMMAKMGRGQEALRQMFKNKMEGR